MTGKKFSGTPCIGEVGSYHAHEGCECASGLPYLHADLQSGQTKEPSAGPGTFKRRGYFL